ncbi:protein FAM124A-like [Actinia tenebrosa]|uniref:Protein FAM124A-like n=1 Tax=Actinia tenebrosa TaxID=6105 RepID=A0A6P8HTF5_ACTTE|nr:protein FAM124A-like [Actinia tenebrosa]
MVIMNGRLHNEDSPNLSEVDTSMKIEGQNHFDFNANQSMPDPFQCTLQIRANKGEVSFLKNLYSPLLEGIDPTFQFICLEESEEFASSLLEWDGNGAYYDEFNVECPALSVVLFLRESFGRLSAVSVQKNLTTNPWKFHHRIELPKDVRPQITATQDFYQAFHDLPLWSVCPVHYGNELLRFHIVVKNFLRMRAFYELITGKKARDGSTGFCYIPIYTQKGLEIQLSLKCLPQVFSKPSTVARLRFKIPNIDSLMPYLVGCPLPVPNEKGTWLTNDPDGNVIILDEAAPIAKVPSLETSDYETRSVETEFSASSKDSSTTDNIKFSNAFKKITPDFV